MADSLSNAQLALQISTLLNAWNKREGEFRNWVGGDAAGGANSDGYFPLSDSLGRSALVPSPAKLADMVSGPAASAVAASETAQALLTSMNSLASDVTAKANSVAADKTATLAARDLTLIYKNNAGTSEANAQVYSQSAETSASAASTAQTGTAADKIATAQYRTDAQTAASAAQASAALAATFNPASYVLLSTHTSDLATKASLSGATFTGPVSVPINLYVGNGGAGSQEGGQINLAKPEANTSLTGDVVVDVAGNYLRIFDGTSTRGLRIDLSTAPTGVGGTIWHSGNLTPSAYLPISGGSISGTVNLYPASSSSTALFNLGDGNVNAQLIINGAAGYSRDIVFRSGGVNRFLHRVDGTGETGGDVGSIYKFYSYSDAGSATTTYSITRADNTVTFARAPKAPTASAGTADTQLATTAFVGTAVASAAYLPLSGGDVSGSVSAYGNLVATKAGSGYISLTPGNAGVTGYMSLYSDASVRAGYIGYASASTKAINVVSENGYYYAFNQRPVFAGAVPWDSANLNPANYAALSGATMTGSLGIGMAPTAPLQVKGPDLGSTAGSSSLTALFYGYNGNGSYIRFTTNRHTAGSDWSGASARITHRTDASDQAYIEYNPVGATWGMAFGSSGGEIMRLLNNGRVGIGTTSPSQTLDVAGTINGTNVLIGGIQAWASGSIPVAAWQLSADGAKRFHFGNSSTTYIEAPNSLIEFRNGSDAWMARVNNGAIYSTGEMYAASSYRVIRHAQSRSSGNITFSTAAPSGGADGDIWFVYT